MSRTFQLLSLTTCICAASLAAANVARGQAPTDPHAVQPERPTVATHAGTVAPGWLEVEAGIEHDRFAPDVSQSFTPIVAKVGIASRVQLDLFGSAVHNSEATGIGDLGVALKWRVVDGAPVLGDVAIQPALKFPTGSSHDGTGTGTFDGSLLLISSHDLGPLAMDINAGLTRRGGDGSVASKTASLWAASLGGPAMGSLGWTFECFGYPGTGGAAGQPPVVALLGGPTYLVRSWLGVDAGLIVPLTGPQAHALYAGGVYNVGRLWRSHLELGDTPRAKPPY